MKKKTAVFRNCGDAVSVMGGRNENIIVGEIFPRDSRLTNALAEAIRADKRRVTGFMVISN